MTRVNGKNSDIELLLATVVVEPNGLANINSDALPLCYDRLSGAKDIKLGSFDKCTRLFHPLSLV